MKRRGLEIRRADGNAPPGAAWSVWVNVSDTREAWYRPVMHFQERLTAEIFVESWRFRQEFERLGWPRARALLLQGAR